GAIPRKGGLEPHGVGRRELGSAGSRPAGPRVTSRQGEHRREGRRDESRHRSSPGAPKWPPIPPTLGGRGETPRPPRPVASTPARATNGRVCAVATGVALATT